MKDKTDHYHRIYSLNNNNENVLYRIGYCSANLLLIRSSGIILLNMLPSCARKWYEQEPFTSPSTLYLYLAGVTVEVLSKAGGSNVERLSVETANSSLLSMLRGLRTNTCVPGRY